MTKDEALRLALEALKTIDEAMPFPVAKLAIKECTAALEAKDEPVKLRRGDILRCIETDELCTVWTTSTSGKTLVKWKGNDFGSYTAEQIGELFWLEPKEKDKPHWWKLVPIEPTDEMLKAMDECSIKGYDERLYAGHAASVYMAAVDVAPTPPQRTWIGLTEDEIVLISADCAATHQHTDIHFARAIEAKLKEKNSL